jgi:Rrf2 family nitric oxide-sensitive transcriptional repressor
MQLTLFTDYALRMLTYLALREEDEVVTIQEISDAYAVSRHYLLKVANELSHRGYVEAVRGRSGGVRLSADLRTVRLGAFIQEIEPERGVLDCVGKDESDCPVHPACMLRRVLGEAQVAFYRELDRYTIADLVSDPKRLVPLLGLTQKRT